MAIVPPSFLNQWRKFCPGKLCHAKTLYTILTHYSKCHTLSLNGCIMNIVHKNRRSTIAFCSWHFFWSCLVVKIMAIVPPPFLNQWRKFCPGKLCHAKTLYTILAHYSKCHTLSLNGCIMNIVHKNRRSTIAFCSWHFFWSCLVVKIMAIVPPSFLNQWRKFCPGKLCHAKTLYTILAHYSKCHTLSLNGCIMNIVHKNRRSTIAFCSWHFFWSCLVVKIMAIVPPSFLNQWRKFCPGKLCHAKTLYTILAHYSKCHTLSLNGCIMNIVHKNRRSTIAFCSWHFFWSCLAVKIMAIVPPSFLNQWRKFCPGKLCHAKTLYTILAHYSKCHTLSLNGCIMNIVHKNRRSTIAFCSWHFFWSCLVVKIMAIVPPSFLNQWRKFCPGKLCHAKTLYTILAHYSKCHTLSLNGCIMNIVHKNRRSTIAFCSWHFFWSCLAVKIMAIVPPSFLNQWRKFCPGKLCHAKTLYTILAHYSKCHTLSLNGFIMNIVHINHRFHYWRNLVITPRSRYIGNTCAYKN